MARSAAIHKRSTYIKDGSMVAVAHAENRSFDKVKELSTTRYKGIGAGVVNTVKSLVNGNALIVEHRRKREEIANIENSIYKKREQAKILKDRFTLLKSSTGNIWDLGDSMESVGVVVAAGDLARQIYEAKKQAAGKIKPAFLCYQVGRTEPIEIPDYSELTLFDSSVSDGKRVPAHAVLANLIEQGFGSFQATSQLRESAFSDKDGHVIYAAASVSGYGPSPDGQGERVFRMYLTYKSEGPDVSVSLKIGDMSRFSSIPSEAQPQHEDRG